MSCNRASLVSKFSVIPQNISLSTKVTRINFSKYIQKVLSELNDKYKVLSAYINAFSGQSSLKQLMIEKDFVASKQYTEKCKIFVFPKEFLNKSWVEEIDCVTVNKDSEMIIYLVMKVPDTTNGTSVSSIEPTIIPEPMPVNSNKAFQYTFQNEKLRENIISIDFLKEIKRNGKNHHGNHHQERKGAQYGGRNNNHGHGGIAARHEGHYNQQNSNILDLVRNAEEGFNKILKNYPNKGQKKNGGSQAFHQNKNMNPKGNHTYNQAMKYFINNGNNQNSQHRGGQNVHHTLQENRQNGGQHHNRSSNYTGGVNQLSNVNHNQNQKNYVVRRQFMSRQEPSWSSRENSLEKIDKSYDNDLLDTLQNSKPAPKKISSKQHQMGYQGHQSHHQYHHQISHQSLGQSLQQQITGQNISHQQLQPVGPQPQSLEFNDISISKLCSQLGGRSNSNLSQLLNKRPPSNNLSKLQAVNSSVEDLPLPPPVPGFERKSFLQTAISSIQVQNGSLGSMLVNSQVPNSLNYGKKTNNNPMTMSRGDPYFNNKKKSSYSNVLCGANPLMKNQFF